MKGWQSIRLGDAIKTNQLSVGKDYPHEKILYLDTGSITCGKVEVLQELKLETAPSRARRIVQDNDIVYSAVRPIQRHYGFISNPPDNLIVSTGFVVITCDSKKISSKYLYHYLTANSQVDELDMIAEASTSTYPSLKPEDIENLNIFFPENVCEQKAIASVLSSLDDKIDFLHRQIATLEALAETLFRQWFEIEADDIWQDGCLGDAVEVLDNKRIPLSNLEREKMKGGFLYPYYGAAQIMDYVNQYIFDGEYILLGEDGTVRTDEGYPVLQYAMGKFWVNNHTHVLQAKAPYSNFLIWCLLKKRNIDEIVTGAVQPKINQGNLLSLTLPDFPDDLINRFNQVTAPVFGKIKQNRSSVLDLEKLRDTLLPKLMSGEVRVAH